MSSSAGEFEGIPGSSGQELPGNSPQAIFSLATPASQIARRPASPATPQRAPNCDFAVPARLWHTNSTRVGGMPEGKGLLIVYTGPGKGKTTCALGTAFRAVGQGLRVLMVQFIKGSWHYGELDAAKMLGDDKFEILPMGRGFVKVGGADTDPEDVRMCEAAWEFGRERIFSGKYDLVILDEINYVISYKMLDAERVVESLAARPEQVHVICTGRNAHPKLVEAADLVTEMREVRHPYTKGILAQRGIDY
ncbi:MAG TPA: cob(I)yrinic acid a,c-diamide adenosyltransferase [Candidatus Acidoferrum sp.]|nr:cob(I)yrinic acid a,c-diamide adenosyltransferase [Candidatus Acidoferrum sp.]